MKKRRKGKKRCRACGGKGYEIVRGDNYSDVAKVPCVLCAWK